MANLDINAIMQMMNGNPMGFLQSKMVNNPQIGQLKNQLINMQKSSGMSGKEFAMQYAKQNGIDPKQLEALASRLGIK